MACTIIRPKTHQEWLDVRKGGIGSSEVGTILGVNPYETPYQLWRRKVGLDAPKTETFAMKAGHYLEDAVSRFYADETQREIIKASAGDWIMRDNEREFLQVSPDRTFWLDGKHSANNKGILECKTTQRPVDVDNIPESWYCQLQYQLGVAGYTQGALAWLKMGREFGFKDYDFDADFYGWITEEISRFWFDNIIGMKEPDSMRVEDVLLRNPRHVAGKAVEASQDILDQLKELKSIKEELAEATARKTAIEDAIKMAMQDAEALTTCGDTLVTWKAAKESLKFDEKRFKAEHPDTWSEYAQTKQGARTFLLKI